MDTDLDTLATALYVTCDGLLKSHPERVPARPVIGLQPQITDAELLTLAVRQALLATPANDGGYVTPELGCCACFPRCRQSGYNKRLRKLADTMSWLIGALGAGTSVVTDCVRPVHPIDKDASHKKARAHRKSRMDTRTRERLPVLPKLVA